MKREHLILMPPGWEAWSSRAGYQAIRFDANSFPEDRGLGVAWTDDYPTGRLMQREVARIVGVPVEKWGCYYQKQEKPERCPACGEPRPKRGRGPAP